MAMLQLFIKGELITEREIHFSAFNYDLEFECNVQFREMELIHAKEKLKLIYLRRIMKNHFDYNIVLVVQSKLNNQPSDELWQET